MKISARLLSRGLSVFAAVLLGINIPLQLAIGANFAAAAFAVATLCMILAAALPE
jgi:hypothetical protein